MTVCFCTLAIHAPYRERARRLCADAPSLPWVILTDEPDDFRDLPQVEAVYHAPTGPMAIDYLTRLPKTGGHRGAAAYHDKRHVLACGLQRYETAIFLDADSRLKPPLPAIPDFPPGLSVLPTIRHSVSVHLLQWGAWRRPVFEGLARAFTGDTVVLDQARWCQESAMAMTRDPGQTRFFDLWGQAADYLQSREVFSGEGGVIGLAAHLAGWSIQYDAWATLAPRIRHEGKGPKAAKTAAAPPT